MIADTITRLKKGSFKTPLPYFPSVLKREKWDTVPEFVSIGLVEQASQLTARTWESIPASKYLDYTRTGDREQFQTIFFAKRRDLIILTIAECLQNEGTFVDAIVDGTWSICEETTWCVPAHNNGYLDGVQRTLADLNEPIIDLFAAQTAAALTAVLCMVGEVIDNAVPQVTSRIRREIDRRIITPFLDRDDFWWMGFTDRAVNNWNPWIISNILLCLLLSETNEVRRTIGAAKAVKCLKKFLDTYADDGGCDEGSSYWGRAGGSLFDCADILYEATNGEVDWFTNPKVREMGKFILHSHIEGDYYVNFADGPGVLKHHSPQLVFRYGKRIGDLEMQALAAAQYRAHGMGSVDQSAIRSIPAMFLHEELQDCDLPYQPVTATWLPGIQFMTTRIDLSAECQLFIAAKGGNNAESHNHNDVGNFIIYVSGQPVVIDAGVGTYTAKTFSENRYDIWYMRSDYHNLPTINGVCQIHGTQAGIKNGTNAAAQSGNAHYETDKTSASLQTDLTQFYPETAGISDFRRTVSIDKTTGEIAVVDLLTFLESTNDVDMHIITLSCPLGNHRISVPVPGGFIVCTFSDEYNLADIEPIVLDDERLGSVWGPQIYRTTLHADVSSGEVALKILFSPGLE